EKLDGAFIELFRTYKYRPKIGKTIIPIFLKKIGDPLFPLILFGIVRLEIYIEVKLD
ncbi:MAG: hypothetical protein RL656_310, partial [Bacteroidota bacterium]